VTELDGELPETVAELINEFGADISYQYVKGSVYDPAKSSSVVSVGLPMARKAIIEDYDLQGSGASLGVGLIKSGDKKLSVAAFDFPVSPSPGDKTEVNGDAFSVVNVKTVYSGQLPALHELQVRS